MIWRLAFVNLMGAGIRTWLNAAVLSLVLVGIITAQGLLEGMNRQAVRAAGEAEVAGGHLRHPAYDPYDPLTLSQAHGAPPQAALPKIAEGAATPILIVQGTAYPAGRMTPVLIKGIDPAQTVLAIPSRFIAMEEGPIPALIGARMARSTRLQVGDFVTLQWRDARGAFDAVDVRIEQVMDTPVQSIDAGQIWLPLERLRELTGMQGEATILVLRDRPARGRLDADPAAGKSNQITASDSGEWTYHSPDELLRDVRDLIQAKAIGSLFVYAILVFLAMVAIFDTQIFSIFRRQREMGTLISLGMTRGQVMGIFTLEGAMHALLAAVMGAIYGVPLLAWFAARGWTLPETTDRYGFALGDTLYPVFTVRLVAGTLLLIFAITAAVSYLPTRRIAKVSATDALRGRVF